MSTSPIEFKKVGRYLTSGQPSLADLDHHAADGLVAVVNVRPISEQAALGFSEQEEVASRGLKYLNIPVSGPGDFTVEKARLLDEFLGGVPEGNVLVHCAGGNRAAGLLTLRAKLAEEDLSIEHALDFGHQLGLKAPIESPVTQLLSEIK